MTLKFISLSAVGVLALASASAHASVTVTDCPTTGPTAFTTSPAYTACDYVITNGGALGGSAAKIGAQEAAINHLLGITNYSVDWTVVNPTKADFSFVGGGGNTGTLTYSGMLFGKTIIGVHFGNGNPSIGNSTAFFLFDFTKPTSSIDLDVGKGYSVAALYSTQDPPAVPEPAAWALMIVGFGAVGGALRRTKKAKIALTYA